MKQCNFPKNYFSHFPQPLTGTFPYQTEKAESALYIYIYLELADKIKVVISLCIQSYLVGTT